MDPILAFTAPGWPEILFILLIILVLFGAKRLPELAKGLGQSINEFRKAREELDREVKKTAVTLEAKEAPDKEPHKPA
jgi:sec-independent protein translocase protein TatA